MTYLLNMLIAWLLSITESTKLTSTQIADAVAEVESMWFQLTTQMPFPNRSQYRSLLKQWKERRKMKENKFTAVLKFFRMTEDNFIRDFSKNAFEVDTIGTDGKTRRSYFYRGYYITHKWKKNEAEQWYQYWVVRTHNPHYRKTTESMCKSCEHYCEGVKPSTCKVNIEMQAAKKLQKMEWSAEENDLRFDHREDKEVIASWCMVHDEDSWIPLDKPQPRIFPEADPEIDLEILNKEKKEYLIATKARIAMTIRALDGHTMQDFYRNCNKFILAFDNIDVNILKETLIEQQMKVMTMSIQQKYGPDIRKFKVITCTRPVSRKDNAESIRHIRDIMRFNYSTLHMSKFGTLMGQLKVLEKTTLNVIEEEKSDIPFWKYIGKKVYKKTGVEVLVEPKRRLEFDDYEAAVQEYDYGSDEEMCQEQYDDLIRNIKGVVDMCE